MSHATFPGVVLASVAGVSLFVGGWAFGVVVALLVGAAGRQPGARRDERGRRRAGGIVRPRRGRPLGPPDASRDLSAFLVGSVLTVTRSDIVTTAVVAAALLLTLAVLPQGAGARCVRSRRCGRPRAIAPSRLDVLVLVVVTDRAGDGRARGGHAARGRPAHRAGADRAVVVGAGRADDGPRGGDRRGQRRRRAVPLVGAGTSPPVARSRSRAPPPSCVSLVLTTRPILRDRCTASRLHACGAIEARKAAQSAAVGAAADEVDAVIVDLERPSLRRPPAPPRRAPARVGVRP